MVVWSSRHASTAPVRPTRPSLGSATSSAANTCAAPTGAAHAGPAPPGAAEDATAAEEEAALQKAAEKEAQQAAANPMIEQNAQQLKKLVVAGQKGMKTWLPTKMITTTTLWMPQCTADAAPTGTNVAASVVASFSATHGRCGTE